MAISKIISTKSAHNLTHYILDGHAHNNQYSNARNLLVGGHNIFSDYQNKINSNYVDSQFYAVRKMAGKTSKKTQAFHNIYSFSESDFPPPKNKQELQKQAQQAYKLVNDFLRKQLPADAQYLVGIQRDGQGGMLHAHVAINSVLINQKVLDTNSLSLLQKVDQRSKTVSKGLLENWQDYLTDNFKKVTGRKYERVERDLSNLVNSSAQQVENRGGYVWKEDLKNRIVEAVQNSTTLDEFKQTLQDVYGVSVKEYQSSTGKVNSQGKKIKRLAYTYMFKDDNGKQHKSRDFHITKKGAVRGLGEFTRPQSLQEVLEQNLQREQQQLQQLQQVQIDDLRKDDNNGKTRQPVNAEPEYKPRTTVKKIKRVEVDSTAREDYQTTAYDQQTEQLRVQNRIEKQRRADAEAERKRKDIERKRKRQQEQARRLKARANSNQRQFNQTIKSARNIEYQSRGYNSDDRELE